MPGIHSLKNEGTKSLQKSDSDSYALKNERKHISSLSAGLYVYELTSTCPPKMCDWQLFDPTLGPGVVTLESRGCIDDTSELTDSQLCQFIDDDIP